MKRMFKLEGLDCANCAAKAEAAIGKIAGIKSVSINFFSLKMTIEAEEADMLEVEAAAEKVLKSSRTKMTRI